MRLSSTLALISMVIGFLSVLTPACFYLGYGTSPDQVLAMSWIELQESPVLWIYLAVTFIVGAHDIEILQGIDFIRKSNIKILRTILLIIGVLMAFSLELSVNVYYSEGPTFWKESLFFQIPDHELIQEFASIGYFLIRICRLILTIAVVLSIFDIYTPSYYRKLALDAREEYIKRYSESK